jgi:hypothetical protein
MAQLVIERICADMCDFYEKFYYNEGPGAIVYVPGSDDLEKSMFYLPVAALIQAQSDFNSREMEGPASVMQKAIARAESIDPTKQGLFIIQDEKQMSLICYERDQPLPFDGVAVDD